MAGLAHVARGWFDAAQLSRTATAGFRRKCRHDEHPDTAIDADLSADPVARQRRLLRMSEARIKPARRHLVRPRLYLGGDLSLGPGKIDLLRQVGESGSISAAARELGVPYKRAWLLIDSLNRGFPSPVLETATGGKAGGGARLTPLGRALIEAYDALEARLNTAASAELAVLTRLVEAPAGRSRRARPPR
jgi:molybdate transport system regulatory protein